MNYKQIRLKNFSSYRDQTFDLLADGYKNVVIFYGLNGDGKTTIINGVKLALQGSDAGLMEDETYEQYLREHFNHQALHEGEREAFVSVVLFDGEKNIEVKRSWYIGYQNVIEEEVKIFEGKEVLKELRDLNEESKREYLENLISKEVLNFFAFDAELIPYMQDDYEKAKRLGEDIAKTLGIRSYEITLDLTKKYLDTLKRRLKPARKSQLTILTGEIEAIDEKLKEIEQSKRDFVEKLHEIEALIRDNRAWLSQFGDDGERSKALLEEKLATLRENKERIETSSIRYANELLPYVMINQELTELREQLKKEENWLALKEVNDMQEDMLHKVLACFEEDINPPLLSTQLEILIKRIKDVYDFSRSSEENEKQVFYHFPAISENDKEALQDNINEKWEKVLCESAVYQNDFQNYEHILSELDITIKQIKMLPNAEKVGTIQSEILELDEKVQNLRNQIFKLDEEFSDYSSKRSAKIQELKNANLAISFNSQVEEKIKIINNSKSALEEFVKSLRLQKASQVLEYAKDIFNSVSHKDRSFESFDIDNETFELTMYNRFGDKHPKRLMSKGERQLLSLALTYAIAKSSGDRFGFIIDTPFSRIDGPHRENFLKKFVPEMGQVIFLSHDREIEERDREMIADRIAREYTISIDVNGVTQVENSYKWGTNRKEIF